MADPRGGGLRDRMVKEVIPRDEPACSFDVAVAVAALTLLTLGLLPLVKDDESGDKTN